MSEQQAVQLIALLLKLATDVAKVREVLEQWDANGIPHERVSD